MILYIIYTLGVYTARIFSDFAFQAVHGIDHGENDLENSQASRDIYSKVSVSRGV